MNLRCFLRKSCFSLGEQPTSKGWSEEPSFPVFLCRRIAVSLSDPDWTAPLLTREAHAGQSHLELLLFCEQKGRNIGQ